MENFSSQSTKKGRKPKFKEKSRLVTITLPTRLLDQLDLIDKDRSRVIAHFTDYFLSLKNQKKSVEIVPVSEKEGVLAVGDCKILENIEWIKLVGISPVLNIISLKEGSTVELLEIALIDLIDNNTDIEQENIETLNEILNRIRRSRRSDSIKKREILMLNIDKS